MKSFYLSLAAIICSAGFASAQGTITKSWMKNTTASGLDARQGVAVDGKFYLQNRVAKVIEVWDETGKISTLPSTGNQTGIACDDAGNIIVANNLGTFGGETGYTRNIRIYPKGSTEAVDVELTWKVLNDGEKTPLRCDVFGHVEGDVMSAEGGVMCMIARAGTTGQLATTVTMNVTPIKLGKQDVENTLAVEVVNALEPSIASWASMAERKENGLKSVPCFKKGEKYYANWYYMGLKEFTVAQVDGQYVAQNVTNPIPAQSIWAANPANAPVMIGATSFTLNGKEYGITPVIYKGETASAPSFAVIDIETGEKVATYRDETIKDILSEGNNFGSWFSVYPIDTFQAEIYQYYPGKIAANAAGDAFVAKYIFNRNVSGVDNTLAEKTEKLNVIGMNGAIIVNGDATVQVYSTSGALVAEGKNEIPVPAGLYIVKAGNKAEKIVVK